MRALPDDTLLYLRRESARKVTLVETTWPINRKCVQQVLFATILEPLEVKYEVMRTKLENIYSKIRPTCVTTLAMTSFPALLPTLRYLVRAFVRAEGG